MSNSLNKKYDWDSHLPKMISLYFTDMSIPDICKAIQDEETGFTPKYVNFHTRNKTDQVLHRSRLKMRSLPNMSQLLTCSRVRMVYNKLKSEGYPTDKNQRAEKAFQLARQHGLAASGSSSGIPPILPTFSDHTNDGYDVAFHPPTSWPMTSVAPQALVITGEGTPSIVEHAHTSDVPFVGEHSKALNAENHSEFPEISNYQAIDATSDTSPYWTAELAQRQSSFAADPSTFLGVIGSPLVVSTESTTFDNQEWFNDGTLSGYDQQLQNSHPWEQEELASHQDYGSTAAMEDHNTPQLPLLTDATDGVGEDNLGEMAMIPERPSTSAETQLDGIPATSSDDHNTSTYSGGNDVLMNTFSASVDVTSDDGRIQTGKQSSCCSRNTPSPIDNPTFGGRMVSWVNPKVRHLFNRSSSPEKRDSGYASGRNSPLTPVVENARPHPSSLLEFKGLYRVSCQQLHEPPAIDPFYIPASRTMERFKETPTCSQCLYSSIHNLSWSASARYLKLEVFKADLKLDSKYDITALDKAGNSALHYAASGGAGFEHFLALIQAGANPYQINTAGQLFLHCLRPHIREIGSEGFDDNLVAVFHADLVNLLNFFQPKGAFRWRDNEGRTVLDALASNIKDTEMRTRTFR
jgi:ankyrin repeat protein